MRALAAVAALGIGSAWLVSQPLIDALVFQPTPGRSLDPRAYGIEAQDVWLEPEPGLRVHAYWVPSDGATRAILFLHGNAGDASMRLPNAAALAQLGSHVLVLDYRGFGLSEGSPSESGVYRDAEAALAHLVEVRGIAEQRVILFGRSLGAAVAVELARGRRLGGVILEAAFTSISDVARGLLGPVGAWLARGRFASDAKIAELRTPLLMFHGDRDATVDIALGRRLFEIAPEPKEFQALAGAGHNDTVQVGGRVYLERIRSFSDRVAPPRSEAAP